MIIMKLFGGVFATIGAALFVSGAVVAWNVQSFRAHASRADGTVVALVGSPNSGSTPVVVFDGPNGEPVRIQGSVASSPPAYAEGEKVTVFYDPQNPKEASIDGFFDEWFVTVLLGGIGLVFMSFGVPVVAWTVLRGRKVKWLRERGRRVQVRIQQVGLDTRVRVNGRHPFRIIGEWLDATSNTVHIYKSDMLFSDPSSHLKGETIDVLIDPSNPKSYWMDTSFLPKVAE
jgi:hypothetical protein